jgi:AcrR family transcriptional regulator
VPRLWNDTIEAHRQEVRDAILEATAALVSERGLRSVTMLEIAEKTGIGRATLYKYFPDVEAILLAWHERHVGEHLKQLVALHEEGQEPEERLKAVLEGFARIQHQHEGLESEISSLLHRGEHVARAQQHLTALVRGLLVECAKAGVVRKDIPAEELATYCLCALSAASRLRSKTAVSRLVAVTLGGLRAPRS